ncbi:hypothetical protein WP8S17C03_44790 [Metapseudomonas otitidis]|uniref:Uncharacterized protein n=1 Tax=Metapseudomonas otitidis TaxID=319939 RepID=A0A6S5RUQ8_9GAMM|nr:hypothetical protein [Pseudomonas otitidis]BBT18430.1 hypothetical protein WP8S17C03_44790 [Pseudomonas otitidis]
MSRRFNFTGRVRIHKDDIRITIDSSNGSSICSVCLRLEEYSVPSDARVIVEAERGRALRLRHEWGYAGNALSSEGGCSAFDVSSMGDLEDVRFRVLVVEPSTSRLLAAAEGVEAHSNDDIQESQRSLLPIVMKDLYGGVWELEDMDGTPTLALDINLGTKNELKSSPVLFSILPGVVRAILVYQALERSDEEPDEDTGDSTSATRWLELGSKWAGFPCPGNAEYRDIDDWAQKAVTGFCREKKLRSRLCSFMSQED